MKKRFNLLKSIVTVGMGILVAVVIRFLPFTWAKYQTDTNSEASISYAFYILKADYYTKEVRLGEIVPRKEPYVYKFKVANYNDSKMAETNLEYELSIETTTNLPLRYELYMDQEYDDQDSSSIIDGGELYQDGDISEGAYFKKFTTNSIEFSYKKNEEHTYQLVVYFPENYTDSDYQDMIEGIFINISSKQIIDSDVK